MKEILVMILTGLGAIFVAFWNGKRSQKKQQIARQNEESVKLIKDVKKRSKKRSSDSITDVKRRLHKNTRD